MTRTEILKASIKSSARQQNRANLNHLLDSKSMICSIAERKAYALKNVLDNMPLHIDEEEIIVGTRTYYKIESKVEENLQQLEQTVVVDIDTDDIPLNLNDTDDGIHVKSALPHYINEKDIEFFGNINQEFATYTRFTPDYSILVKIGLDEVIAKLYKTKPESKIQKDFKNAILIAYMGLRTFINRYQKYAIRMSKADRIPTKRRIELMQIANTCQHIKHKKPRNFQEATQLYWFAHLVSMIDSGNCVNYGKIDDTLGSFYKDNEKDQNIIKCLLLKFNSELDESEKKLYNKSIILTGSITNEENGANMLTLAILDNIANLELTHPVVNMYIDPNNGERYLKKATKLSEKGINIIKYFNVPKFNKDLIANGIPEAETKRVNQDILANLGDDFYTTGKTDLTELLNKTLLELGPVNEDGLQHDLASILNAYKQNIKDDVASKVTNYFKIQTAVTNFAKGTEKQLLDSLKDETINKQMVRAFMAPLPFTSGLFENCIENSTDVTWFGENLKVFTYVLDNPVTAVNTLGSIKKHVFDEKTITLPNLKKAFSANFKGEDKLRKALSSTKYWGNGMIDYDLIAKEIIEFSNMVISSIQLPNGAKIFAYVNQDEPVSSGMNLSATADGRLNDSPVTNSVLTRETSDALLAIEPQYKLGNFFTVDRSVNKEICIDLVKPFFRLGGHKFIPTKVELKFLKEAQKKPEKHPNLMVYYKNQFIKFIEAEPKLQDEIMLCVKNGMI